jgi:hypothetical protein
MPPLGKYLTRIAPANAPWSSILAKKKQLWHCETASTQLIEATSCVEKSNVTIEAEELSYLSSHQTLTMDKNW